MGQAGGDLRGKGGAGFAGIHADEHARRIGVSFCPFAEGAAEGVDGAAIERVLTGDATNAVCAEELAGHD